MNELPEGDPPPPERPGQALIAFLKVVMWVFIGIVVLGFLLFGTCLLLFRH
jgi:hypothetical protein